MRLRKHAPASLALLLLCMLTATCRTTPSATASQPSAAPGKQAQTPGASGQSSKVVTESGNPSPQPQEPAAQVQNRGSPQRPAPSALRPVGKEVATALGRLQSAASSGAAGVVRSIKTLLGIKPGPPRAAPRRVSAPASSVLRMPNPTPDFFALIVTGVVIVAGSGLTLAAVFAGRAAAARRR